MPKLLLTVALLSAGILPAEPPVIPPMRAAVEVPGQDQLRFGTLSLTPGGVKFDSDELLFTVPVKDLEDLQVAGFRERFLTLQVRKDSEFSRAYAFLFADPRKGQQSNSLSLSFQLGPKETLRTAVEEGKAYREQVADQFYVHPLAPAASMEVSRAARSPLAGDSALVTLPKASVGTTPTHPTAASPLPPSPRELFRLSGRYLEKRKRFSSLVITGTQGELVFFEDTIGFRSQEQNPRLGSDKAKFVQDGYLKFRIGNKDIESVSYQPVNGSNTALVLTINRQSSFYAESKALLTDTKTDNELVFLIPSRSSQNQLPGYFHSRVGSGF